MPFSFFFSFFVWWRGGLLQVRERARRLVSSRASQRTLRSQPISCLFLCDVRRVREAHYIYEGRTLFSSDHNPRFFGCWGKPRHRALRDAVPFFLDLASHFSILVCTRCWPPRWFLRAACCSPSLCGPWVHIHTHIMYLEWGWFGGQRRLTFAFQQHASGKFFDDFVDRTRPLLLLLSKGRRGSQRHAIHLRKVELEG